MDSATMHHRKIEKNITPHIISLLTSFNMSHGRVVFCQFCGYKLFVEYNELSPLNFFKLMS